MFIGRKEEKKQLETAYLGEHSNLLMLYGREGIGKTALALEFCRGKEYYYFCTPDTTKEMLKAKLLSVLGQSLNGDRGSKKVLILDSFGSIFDDELISMLLDRLDSEEKVMIILISSSINWVENSMVDEAGRLAKALTGIIKLKELKFREIVEWFPKMSVEECIAVKACLGGVPGYLKQWQENRRIRENLISLLLTKGSALENEAEHLLKLELRELSAYNSILLSLAGGHYKLGEIYTDTGFSRAKISVYLKNLIQMDIVEKVNCANVIRYENTQKGLYRIKDSFLRFYYAFVFPNMEAVEEDNGRKLFDEVISGQLTGFIREAYAEVAREFLQIMGRKKALKAQYTDYRVWIGKSGIVDIVAKDENCRNTLAAMCSCEGRDVDVEQVEAFLALLESAGLDCTEIWMFSDRSFSVLAEKRMKQDGIMYISMNDL